MSIIKIYRDYHKGMSVYNACHQPNFNNQWQAFKDEVLEFKEEPSISETWDILHSGGKVIYAMTKIPLHLLAFPTVKKHSQRYSQFSCVRSKRNCEGKCCSIE